MNGIVRRLLALVVTCGFPACALAAPAPRPAERIIVHIPLAFNDGTPVSRSELHRLIGELSVLGAVTEYRGHGTYVDSLGRVSVEPVDHVAVTTTSPRAERIVDSVLHRIRGDLHQEAALAEVLPDPHTWEEESRVQFDVVITAQGAACDRTCTTVRRLLDDAGGGDSEYDHAGRAHLMSSVPTKLAMHVRTALRTLRLSFTEHPAAFVLVTTRAALRRRSGS